MSLQKGYFCRARGDAADASDSPRNHGSFRTETGLKLIRPAAVSRDLSRSLIPSSGEYAGLVPCRRRPRAQRRSGAADGVMAKQATARDRAGLLVVVPSGYLRSMRRHARVAWNAAVAVAAVSISPPGSRNRPSLGESVEFTRGCRVSLCACDRGGTLPLVGELAIGSLAAAVRRPRRRAGACGASRGCGWR